MVKTRYLVAGSALAVVVVALGAAASYTANGLPPLPQAAAPTASAAPTPTAAPGEPRPVGFAVVGDSITAWAGQEAGSWTSYVGSDGLYFSGHGWARNGAPLAMMEANTPRLDEDVLVVLAGTNDLRSPVALDDRLDVVDAIVRRSGVDRVLISAVPPFDPDPRLGTAWNAALREHASGAGYAFVDPWSGLRVDDGSFDPDATIDGIHPTPAAAERAAQPLRSAIIAAAG